MTAAAVPVYTLEERRRRAVLLNRKREAIIFTAGPTHPDFGIAFMKYFLQHYCSEDVTELGEVIRRQWVGPADWHPELYSTVFGAMGAGQMHVHEAPRGYAKSTIANVALPIAILGLGGIADRLPYPIARKQYVWVVSDTVQQARQAMESILSETQGVNKRVLQHFPHLAPGVGRHNRPLADRDDDIIFASGQRLQALSAGQKLRGRRHRQYRPDVCLVDDLENDEAVLTKYQRDKLDAWFSKSLLPALAKGADLHYLGTPLHVDGLLYRLKARAGFRFHRYEALRPDRVACLDHGWHVDGGRLHEECDLCFGTGFIRESSWPYRDEYWHAQQRARMGSRAYTQEVLLQPIDESNQMFKRDWFKYRTIATSKGDLPDGYRVRIAVDPAAKDKTRHDFSAITVVGRMKASHEYDVLDEWHGKVRGQKVLDKAAEMYGKWGGIVLYEDVQAQEWAKQNLEDQGIPVRGVNPGGRDKTARGEPVSLHYEMGRVWHVEALRDSQWEEQLEQFPEGENDDCPDTLFYAVKDLENEPGGGIAGVVRHDTPRQARERAEAKEQAAPAVAGDELDAMIVRLTTEGVPIPWDRLTQDAAVDLDNRLGVAAAAFTDQNYERDVRPAICLEARRTRPMDLPSGHNDPRFG